ncbi:ATP-binding protein [Brevundimonas sp.]|jgi:signal transduction histidine kinase|uniref:ATP-binding protein n=1 Tax=Brevundimonas sp. TaxID=1871086 RepID=UPI0037C1229F
MTHETSSITASQSSPVRPPLLHRLVRAGQLRYWIILSWALVLSTTAHWRLAVLWFVVTATLGLVRTVIERRPDSAPGEASLTLLTATLSCVAWAFAPLIAYFAGGNHGLTIAVALLMAGYTLVFTQMRAALREALIVSTPYSVVVVILAFAVPGQDGAWTILSLIPMLGLSLLVKIVITQIKDSDLAAVNAGQAALIVDLAAARDRADAASEAKTNFLAVVSHELRTPMNGVLGAAQLLENTPLADAQQSYVSIIRQSGEGLLVQLNDILDLTKIEAGHMAINLAEVVGETLVKRIVGPFRAQAEAKGLGFRVEQSGPLPAVVRLDELRVAQIAHNLLGNAVKFTESGEIILSVVQKPISTDRVQIGIHVSDTGIGISDEDLGQLFQPFTQVDASSTRRFGGTGLGLSICRQLAHLMDGEITVTSRLGHGSTFAFEFEAEVVAWAADGLTDDEAQSAMAIDERSEGGGQALRVLVVEDHPVNRMVLQTWLGAVGHDCTVAENGQIALDCAGIERFDLIIMDVNMPVMDGLVATRELRARPGPNQETPIAVLSASARPEDHLLGYAAGADVYVDKPVDFAALAGVLETAPFGRMALHERRRAPVNAA